MAELETCCEVEEKLIVAEKALDKIADLEAKLAEKDRQLKVMRELKNRHYNYYKTCETEYSQLKQQLAEKEEVLKELIDAVVVAIDLLGIDIKKAYPKLYNEFLAHQQDKGE